MNFLAATFGFFVGLVVVVVVVAAFRVFIFFVLIIVVVPFVIGGRVTGGVLGFFRDGEVGVDEWVVMFLDARFWFGEVEAIEGFDSGSELVKVGLVVGDVCGGVVVVVVLLSFQ